MGFEDIAKTLVILCGLSGFVAIGYVAFRYAMVPLKRRETDPASNLPADIEARLETLEIQLAEVHERLDFAERLLAQTREPEQLARGDK